MGVIYRPPNTDVNLFIHNFDELLGKISRENKICYLLGDFNLNLISRDSTTGMFLDGLYSNSFIPRITCPTRITSHTATLIDNIFTNHYVESINGLFLTDISDHLPIFSICFMNPSCDDDRVIFIRDKSANNMNKFKQQVSNINWLNLNGINDPNNAYKSFLNKFNEIYEDCFPLKKLKNRCNFNSKPWLSNGLLKSIKKKHELYRGFLKNPSAQSELLYKTYKNKLNHSLRLSKRLYYEKKL